MYSTDNGAETFRMWAFAPAGAYVQSVRSSPRARSPAASISTG